MSFQTGREGKGVRSSADRRFKDKSAAYTVWKYFSWLILTALWLTEDVLIKGHCVFRRNHYFIKAGINSLQSESNQNIKNKSYGQSRTVSHSIFASGRAGLWLPPPQFVAANTLPFSKLITFKYESFQENETKCKTSCTVVYKTSAFSTWELKYTRQYLKKSRTPFTWL